MRLARILGKELFQQDSDQGNDRLAATLWDLLVGGARNLAVLSRLSGHIFLLILIAAVGVANRIRWDFVARAPQPVAVNQDANFEWAVGGPELNEAYFLGPNPLTSIPRRERREITSYVVQPNDTVSAIAVSFGLKPETVLWANTQLENDPDLLTVGEELKIPPVDGVLHNIRGGDTVESIAKQHKVEPQGIFDSAVNALTPGGPLTLGTWLMVPNGRKPIVQKAVRAFSGPVAQSALRGSASFGWPVSGRITQNFWSGHLGLDIGAPTGTPVKASDSGFVTFAGWDNTGFGRMILIDHGNGYLTLYAHLDVFAVAAGDSVKKGQLIGRVGNTGRSTGPHLDFRIRQNGVWRNPFGLLR